MPSTDAICECGHYDFDHEYRKGVCAFRLFVKSCECDQFRPGITVTYSGDNVTARMNRKLWDFLMGNLDTTLAELRRIAAERRSAG